MGSEMCIRDSEIVIEISKIATTLSYTAPTQLRSKSARNLVCKQTSFLVHNARGSTDEFHLKVPVTDGEIAAAVAILCIELLKDVALLAPQVYYTVSLHVSPKNAL